jgi:protein-L-isoaspartate(D-aspartate) O-methyltransferase
VDTVEEARKSFAEAMGIASRSPGGRVSEAFAKVPREDFLGKGPWQIFSFPSDYEFTATDDPCELYRNVVVGLMPEKLINNGQPSLHAVCLGLLDPKAGETVVHIGAGSGYYTAILAHLVSPGEVHAYEIEPELAECARQNLNHLRNVQVHATSGSNTTLPKCDVRVAGCLKARRTADVPIDCQQPWGWHGTYKAVWEERVFSSNPDASRLHSLCRRKGREQIICVGRCFQGWELAIGSVTLSRTKP